MNLEEYNTLCKKNGFEEYPNSISGDIFLENFISYNDTDIDLKIHLAKVLICRSFPPGSATYLPANLNWFISSFLLSYENDHLEFWRSHTIKEAIKMIMSDDIFGQRIIGSVFMYGIIEFYAKSKLGFNPLLFNPDDTRLKPYREMSIGPAFSKLKKCPYPISKSINEIDMYNNSLLKRTGIKETFFLKAKIADRLSTSRNMSIHGEDPNSCIHGKYLVMMYILFYLHDVKELSASSMN